MTEILSPKRDAAAAAAWYEDQNNTSRRISFGAGDNNQNDPIRILGLVVFQTKLDFWNSWNSR